MTSFENNMTLITKTKRVQIWNSKDKIGHKF